MADRDLVAFLQQLGCEDAAPVEQGAIPGAEVFYVPQARGPGGSFSGRSPARRSRAAHPSRVAAIAEQLVKQHADGEQLRGSVPLGDVGVGRLIGRRAGLRMHRSAYLGGDVEIEQFRPGAREHYVARFDVAVDGASPFRIGMKSDERVQQVECDVERLPVTQGSLSRDELLQ